MRALATSSWLLRWSTLMWVTAVIPNGMDRRRRTQAGHRDRRRATDGGGAAHQGSVVGFVGDSVCWVTIVITDCTY